MKHAKQPTGGSFRVLNGDDVVVAIVENGKIVGGTMYKPPVEAERYAAALRKQRAETFRCWGTR